MKRLAVAAAILLLCSIIFWPRDSLEGSLEPVQISRAPSVAGEATLLFGGDTALADAALPTLSAKGFEWPFRSTVDLLRDADLAVLNHEAPISDRGATSWRWARYRYRAPAGSAAALAWAGIDLLTLANNHAMDFGPDALDDTIALARQHGMEAIGAGRSGAEARRGAIVTVGDLTIGLIAYLEDQFLFRAWLNLFAAQQKSGVARLGEAALAEDLPWLRRRVDVLVVLLHIGENYAPPRLSTLEWAKRAVELGADLVVCHHPHVAHPVAMHGGKPILLSVGNFAFGTPGSAELDVGWLALAHATGRKLDRVELLPLDVQNRRVEFQPRPLDGDDRDRAIARLIEESRGYGASLRAERGRAIVDIR